MINYNLILTAF